MRILPEMWASTLCPLSSSTRNCVLGKASVTVPSTSMTSSLAKDLLASYRYEMTGTKHVCYHAPPVPPTPGPSPFGSACVRTQGPFSVTAMVCSKCAERELSAVYIDQPSH